MSPTSLSSLCCSPSSPALCVFHFRINTQKSLPSIFFFFFLFFFFAPSLHLSFWKKNLISSELWGDLCLYIISVAFIFFYLSLCARGKKKKEKEKKRNEIKMGSKASFSHHLNSDNHSVHLGTGRQSDKAIIQFSSSRDTVVPRGAIQSEWVCKQK